MTATLLDGTSLSKQIIASLASQIQADIDAGMRAPHLEAILIGEDKASAIYVKNKQKSCQKAGISANTTKLAAEIPEQDLVALIKSLNQNQSVDGILVQLPLPKHISTQKIIEAISVNKDVDGFHPYNVGRLATRKPHLRSCTPLGIMNLLTHYDINPRGMDVTVVGVSNIVGRPLIMEMILAGATVTACHRHTKDLKKHICDAQIIVSATGVMDIIHPEWISTDAIVIDVGIHRLEDGSLRGDLNFAAIKDKVSFVTPVPGGVGPMTVASLLSNTYHAACLAREKS